MFFVDAAASTTGQSRTGSRNDSFDSASEKESASVASVDSTASASFSFSRSFDVDQVSAASFARLTMSFPTQSGDSRSADENLLADEETAIVDSADQFAIDESQDAREEEATTNWRHRLTSPLHSAANQYHKFVTPSQFKGLNNALCLPDGTSRPGQNALKSCIEKDAEQAEQRRLQRQRLHSVNSHNQESLSDQPQELNCMSVARHLIDNDLLHQDWDLSHAFGTVCHHKLTPYLALLHSKGAKLDSGWPKLKCLQHLHEQTEFGQELRRLFGNEPAAIAAVESRRSRLAHAARREQRQREREREREREAMTQRQQATQTPKHEILTFEAANKLHSGLNNECIICLNDFAAAGEKLRHLACTGKGHLFHDACIARWHEAQEKKNQPLNCPICKHEVPQHANENPPIRSSSPSSSSSGHSQEQLDLQRLGRLNDAKLQAIHEVEVFPYHSHWESKLGNVWRRTNPISDSELRRSPSRHESREAAREEAERANTAHRELWARLHAPDDWRMVDQTTSGLPHNSAAEPAARRHLVERQYWNKFPSGFNEPAEHEMTQGNEQ